MPVINELFEKLFQPLNLTEAILSSTIDFDLYFSNVIVHIIFAFGFWVKKNGIVED